jgi:hypothetical protein
LQLIALFRRLVGKPRCLHIVVCRTFLVACSVLFLAQPLAIARVAADSAQLAVPSLPFFGSP